MRSESGTLAVAMCMSFGHHPVPLLQQYHFNFLHVTCSIMFQDAKTPRFRMQFTFSWLCLEQITFSEAQNASFDIIGWLKEQWKGTMSQSKLNKKAKMWLERRTTPRTRSEEMCSQNTKS